MRLDGECCTTPVASPFNDLPGDTAQGKLEDLSAHNPHTTNWLKALGLFVAIAASAACVSTTSVGEALEEYGMSMELMRDEWRTETNRDDGNCTGS